MGDRVLDATTSRYGEVTAINWPAYPVYDWRGQAVDYARGPKSVRVDYDSWDPRWPENLVCLMDDPRLMKTDRFEEALNADG